MKNWLWDKDNFQPTSRVSSFQGFAELHGTILKMTRAEVIEVARQALTVDSRQSENFKDWYIEIDRRRISPKWLVSKLAGIQVSKFTSGEARRVLIQLGLPSSRVSQNT